MGREIGDREYTAKDYEQFNRRIHDQVDILKKVIARPKFGQSETYIGAELELYLMNEQSDVSPVVSKREYVSHRRIFSVGME